MPFRRLTPLRNFVSVAQPYFLPWEGSGADSRLFGPHEPRTLPTHHLQWGPGTTAGEKNVQKKWLISTLLFYFLSFPFSTPLLQTLALLFGFK